jgi:hypothetical protein
MTRAAPPEPAIKSYFFDQGYRDLWATITESWNRNLASARQHFDKAAKLMPGEAADKGLAILWGTAGISVVIFGTAVFLAASAVHVTILLVFFLLVYVGFSLVYLAERGYLTWKQFSTVCPQCHSKNPLPEHYCPGCGEVHRRLVPSSYGILHHTCRCGEKLPATFFLKRSLLQSRCPDCQSLLAAGHTESRKIFVPIFGGPSVGKSALLFAAVEQLAEYASRQGRSAAFLDSKTADEVQRVRQQLGQGRAPDKTLATLPRALNLQIENGRDSRVLYLYDPAGEAFNAVEGLVLHRYQAYLSGLIFLIDPFTLPAVREQYADRLPAVEGALKPSGLPTEEALSRILIGLEEHFGLAKVARIKVPVAVVINKIDAFDLEQVLGEAAVQERLRSSATAGSAEAVRDDVIREQLRRWDQAGLVQQLETRCARLRYFTCSALGRMPDGSAQPFAARGVLEPVLWILGAADEFFATPGTRAA